ncbi:hypothetical protein QYF61_015663 [Mycteria americana]|uniref:Uncharacterized protein n=1 Tax=Mycteria americana TaxID=33587 RepID=A0AAN7RQS5_MYCAM|nr:hypothetical protein QYF61_015663 [Mycteria americana]
MSQQCALAGTPIYTSIFIQQSWVFSHQYHSVNIFPPSNPAKREKEAKAKSKKKCTDKIGNKHDELEICVQLQGYDLVGIMEAWWDGSHDWSIAMEGYRLFRKDRKGRGGRFSLCVSVHLECMELCLGIEKELMESLWVRIKEKTGKGDSIVCVFYRPPNRKERVDEVLYRQIVTASHSQALVLMGT